MAYNYKHFVFTGVYAKVVKLSQLQSYYVFDVKALTLLGEVSGETDQQPA
jgi:hypothetical protein